MVRANRDDQNSSLEGAAYRELRLLEEMDSSPELSQRSMANRLGVALGVANLLVRNLARKGHIRATRAGWKRWVYNLTPEGVTRKTQLTLGYIDRFLGHYRRVRELLGEDLGTLTISSESRMAIYGTTDLAELMYLVLRDMGVTNVDFFREKPSRADFLGLPVKGLESIVPEDYVKVMVASSTDVEARCQELIARGVSPTQVVTLLQNSRPKAGMAEQ